MPIEDSQEFLDHVLTAVHGGLAILQSGTLTSASDEFAAAFGYRDSSKLVENDTGVICGRTR